MHSKQKCNVGCINSNKSDISFITYRANFDFICLTETFAESIDLSRAELKDFLGFVAPAKKLSPRRRRHSGGTAVLVKRSFEKYVQEVYHTFDNIVLFMLNKMVLNTKRNACLRAAYANPFVSPYYDHFNVDNTSCFDAIESVLLDTVRHSDWM